MPTSSIRTGEVARIKLTNGFCFILDDADRRDYFCHASQLEGCALKDLVEGDRVQFQGEEGPKGPRASAVVRIR